MSPVNAYIIIGVSVFFIVGIKLLASPKTARLGNLVAAAGMLLAFLTLHKPTGEYVWSQGWTINYTLIAVATVIGLIIGAIGAYSVKMTSMPQMVAIFNGVGGGAAALVAGLEFNNPDHPVTTFLALSMLFATLIGSLSFSGSIIAFLKLEGKFEKPYTFPGQNILNGLILLVIFGLGGWLTLNPSGDATITAFVVLFTLALVFGVAMVMPIGGADMPVVISLLNSFTGLAVAADGFAINNLAMVVAGTLVGSSGTLLTLLMCKAMNRPVSNVLFGAFGSGGGAGAGGAGDLAGKSTRSIQADEAALLLAYAQQVVVVPGYGMAVAQAQHQVCELSEELGRARGRSPLRHPSRRRPHAGPHERPFGRGERSLRAALRNGSHQSHDGPRRCVPRHRRERRGESRRARGQEQPDLRHAHHRGRPRQDSSS